MAVTELSSCHQHRAAWIDRPLAYLDQQDAAAWRAWLQQVGLTNPNELCLEQAIAVDDDRRTVSYLTWALDDPESAQRSMCVRKEHHLVELDAPPLPFPCGHGYRWWSAFEVEDDELDVG